MAASRSLNEPVVMITLVGDGALNAGAARETVPIKRTRRRRILDGMANLRMERT
jgi:deoxyxylulose-5-phosphate synthase